MKINMTRPKKSKGRDEILSIGERIYFHYHKNKARYLMSPSEAHQNFFTSFYPLMKKWYPRNRFICRTVVLSRSVICFNGVLIYWYTFFNVL